MGSIKNYNTFTIITYNHQHSVLYMHRKLLLNHPHPPSSWDCTLPKFLEGRFGGCSLVQRAARWLYGGRAAGVKFRINNLIYMLVKRLLCTLGFNNVWLAQGVGNVNSFLNLVKQRLQNNFTQNWNSTGIQD